MNLLGQTVRDSVTGITGTVIALAQYLHGVETACITYGEKFEQEWLSVSRLSSAEVSGAKVATEVAAVAVKLNAAATNGAATNGAAPAATKVPAAAAAPAATAPAPATVYADVAKAFMVLGKAGQGAIIQAILKTHGATHAKEISDNAPALADVLVQARAAIAALAA
jgi:hypothetical protein